MRNGSQRRNFIVPVVGLLILGGAVVGGIHWMRGRAHDTPAGNSASASMLADIQRYRETAGGQSPDEAVRQWFALFERASEATEDSDAGGIDTFDPLTHEPVSGGSLFAALPPPPAWPAFHAEAARRAQSSREPANLAIRYLSEVLVGDRNAALTTLGELANDDNKRSVGEARMLLARIYGDASNQLAAFEAEIDRPADEYDDLAVPDLVDIAGEQRAKELLTRAVQSKRVLRLECSEPTRRLARRVALANVSRMAQAQWALANSVDASALYEAMHKRFKKPADDNDYVSMPWLWREAAQYYFLAMVIQGRQADAEKALESLGHGGESDIHIPRQAIEALQRANQNEQLFKFLDGLLARRPDIPAWQLYIEQAAFTGRSQVALARLESALTRKDLAPAQRSRLQSWRFNALLAADSLDQAEAAAAELFALPIKADESLGERVDAASKAMLAGRLLARPDLSRGAEAFTRAVLSLPAKTDGPSYASKARGALYLELRSTGRAPEALALAKAHTERKVDSFSEAFMRRLGENPGGDQESLVEMAGIHLAANQPEQLLALMQTAPFWGADDIAQLSKLSDSLGVAAPILAARALAAKGDNAAALRVARAAVVALPGEDAAYELIARLDPDALKAFGAMFSLDEYEERPLIWKASLQFANGAVDEAEATIRQAIAIDPSDGEEGPNDRMRAYAVLSQILARQGDTADARLYANAVEAIRLSEQGDRFHAAGLYERAFKTYGEALEKFSDAYCIQSRLAVQLNKQGRRQQALVHYRRAYELMPASFGRVESHCFGCESVFEGPEAQSLAERVFTDILSKTPEKPQAHYLLAYLREHQGRYAEALQPLRAAVSLDPRYLNAWKKLNGLADRTYIESGERDIARLKLLELDPAGRHGYLELDEVGDLRGLWSGVEKAAVIRDKLTVPEEGVYRLEASAKLRAEANGNASDEMRQWRALDYDEAKSLDPRAVLYEHALVKNAVLLTRGKDSHDFDDAVE